MWNFVVAAALISMSSGQETTHYSVNPSDLLCTESEYFNTISMQCESCSLMAADEVTATVLIADYRYQDASNKALRCRCPIGYRVEYLSLSDCPIDGSCAALRCIDCKTEGYDTSYSDNSACVQCPSTIADDGDCACDNENEKLVEHDDGGVYLATKRCLQCASGFVVKSTSSYLTAGRLYPTDRYSCQQCPDPSMQYQNGKCLCHDGYIAVPLAGTEDAYNYGALSCVHAAQLDETLELVQTEAEAARLEFRSVQTKGPKEPGQTRLEVQSAVMEYYYLNASTRCLFHDGTEAADAACQTLANLCVLTQYDGQSAACEAYKIIEERRSNSRLSGSAYERMPWLYYVQEGGAVRKDSGLSTEFSFRASSGFEHRLKLVLGAYTLNGTFLGFEDLGTKLFYGEMDAPVSHRGGGESRNTQWMRFGYSELRDHFRINLPLLLAKGSQESLVFYEAYLVDSDQAIDGVCGINTMSTECLYPLPVLNKKLRDSTGEQANRNNRASSELNDIFTRRFVLYDLISGLTHDDSAIPKVIRYLREISIQVHVRSNKPERIFTPWLELEYQERRSEDILESGSDLNEGRIRFSVEYYLNPKEFWRTMDVSFFVFLAITVVAWGSAMRRWRAENYLDGSGLQDGLTLDYCINAFIIYARIFVRVFFPMVLLACTYWLVFFKLQDVVYVLLPKENRDDSKQFNYYPLRIMIIVMWILQTLSVFKLIYDQCTAHELFFIDWEQPRLLSTMTDEQPPVSIWRTLLVANEWNVLQTARRTSIHLNLVCLGFVLVGLKYENNASLSPDFEEGLQMKNPHKNMALQFANTTWWWLIFSLIQFIWNFGFYRRIIAPPASDRFLDICSLAKVSVIIFDAQYHGWYLHGDAPYPHADDTLSELTRHIMNEESIHVYTGHGLDPRLPDVLAYQLWLTPAFRLAWRNVKLKALGDDLLRDSQLITSPRRSLPASPTNMLPPIEPGIGGHQRLLRSSLQSPRASMVSNVSTTHQAPPFEQDSRTSFFTLFKTALFSKANRHRNHIESLRTQTSNADTMDIINSFLRTFLAHGYLDRFQLDWVIRLPSLAERLSDQVPPLGELRNGPVLFQPDQSWFGSDDGWTSVLFLGNDLDLLIQEILTYAVADLWFKSTFLSILLTFLLHHAIRIVRLLCGEQNISDRTLVDKRFLL